MMDQFSCGLVLSSTRKAISLSKTAMELLSVLIQSPERIELKSKIITALQAGHTYIQTASAVYANSLQSCGEFEAFEDIHAAYERLFSDFLSSCLENENYSGMINSSAMLLKSAAGTIFDPDVALTRRS